MRSGLRRLLAATIILTLLLLIGFFVASVSRAQTPTATTKSPTPTINPTVSALQHVVATQEVEIQTLSRETDFDLRDLDFKIRDLQWKGTFFGTIAVAIAAIAGLRGYQAYQGIEEQVRRKILLMANKYYYQIDVTNLNIHVREGEHQDKLIELLRAQGLYNISRFNRLGRSSFSGITVFSIENEADEKHFENHIKRYYEESRLLDTKRAGFILYAPTGYRINPEVIDIYPTTAVANTPWNLVSTLRVLGRHVTAPPKFEEEDQL